MAGIGGLQRSSVSFRRHGSSGMIWDDTRLISGELILKSCTLDHQPHDHREVIMLNVADDHDHQVHKCSSTMAGGGGAVDFHAAAGKVAANDPPSPRVSACGFCSAFRKPNKKSTTTTRPPPRRT